MSKDIDWSVYHAAVYRRKREALKPIKDIDPIKLDQLIGIEKQKRALLSNSKNFLKGAPANNALLWGARGTGKSSLVKAVFNELRDSGLRLIEIYKEDLENLLDIVDDIRELKYKFIIFCDDIGFSSNDYSYRTLKSVLEGSVETPPNNVLIYATSNRRHIVEEHRRDNEDVFIKEGELHYGDSVEEKLSLADRFGLWLSFYQSDQDGFLRTVESYFDGYDVDKELLFAEAKRFSAQRGGNRSGRCAKQFFNYFVNKI